MTLFELVFALWVLGVLIGLVVIGVRTSNNYFRRAADQQAVLSLKAAVERFKDAHGFLPPLVRDDAFLGGPPLTTATATTLAVYDPAVAADVQFLRTSPSSPQYPGQNELRSSVYSLALYIVGPLDAAIDGRDGPGMLEPAQDGSFRLFGGQSYEPLLEGSRGIKGVVAVDTAEGRFEIQDARGVALRYYRWERGQPTGPQTGQVVNPQDVNVPELVGDPAQDPLLRSADYAIVAAGPNGVFGDEPDLQAVAAAVGLPSIDEDRVRAKARADNIVEVGTR